jgi:hypothetical protein
MVPATDPTFAPMLTATPVPDGVFLHESAVADSQSVRHVPCPTTIEGSGSVLMSPDSAKLNPFTMMPTPAFVGPLKVRTSVTTGASNVKKPVRSPTWPPTLTDTAVGEFELMPGGVRHVIDVVDVHLVSLHFVLPSFASGSVLVGPKFAPTIVTTAPLDVGPLGRNVAVTTGALNVKSISCDPTRSSIVTEAL